MCNRTIPTRVSAGLSEIQRGVPQQRERLDSEVGTELLGQVEAVLGAQADDVEGGSVMSASELLDVRRFALAGRSVGRPEPDQQGALAAVVVGERNGRSRTHVDDVDGGECTRSVRSGRLSLVVGRCGAGRRGAVFPAVG